ncbi:NlpC/P60 family protein [Yinghuangia sp. ASG 101]|uniref:C40 family peptidase n=1 Tax=Yinghuangia sp. ASG 101 TaxID=2896848 RepID=UPI001E4D0B95|nr:C40 family peptidase [Yinghuangia sp. ASG 101]UGQ09989.1 NlpC/P60 family protein [Yinghuangia sp. ASG 101]
MASHRRPKKPSKARVGVLTAAAATAVALSSGTSQADPAQSKDQVKAQIQTLNHEAEIATEEFNGFQEKTEQLQAEVERVQERIVQEQADYIALQSQMGAFVSAQYRSAGLAPSLQLMLSENPDDYLNKVSALDQMNAQQAEALKQLQEKKRILDQERAEASQKLGQLDQTRKDLTAKKAEIEQKLQKAQALLNTLTQAEREALLAAEHAAEEKAAAEASAKPSPSTSPSSSKTTTKPSATSTTTTPAANVPVSGRAGAAVAAAAAQIGKPYVYGATGPSSFDCSGLTGYAWKQAGVSLPRTSQGQAGAGRSVSVSQIQPGDLVIYYSGMSHVGIYAGNGQIIHAPSTGSTVRYAPLNSMPVVKVVRVS